ncbi:MAG: hypothetical protein QNL93_06515 [Opitutae bacterium]
MAKAGIPNPGPHGRARRSQSQGLPSDRRKHPFTTGKRYPPQFHRARTSRRRSRSGHHRGAGTGNLWAAKIVCGVRAKIREKPKPPIQNPILGLARHLDAGHHHGIRRKRSF